MRAKCSRRRLVQLAIGCAILCGLLGYIDWRKLSLVLKRSDWFLLLPYFILMIGYIWLRALRLLLLGNAYKGEYVASAIYVLSYTYLIGLFTPARLGEMVRIWPMQKFGISKNQGITLCFLERMFDLTVLLGCGTISLLMLPQFGISTGIGYSMTILILLGGFAILYMSYWKLEGMFRLFLRIIPFLSSLSSLKSTSDVISQARLEPSNGMFSRVLGLSVLIQSLAFTQLYLVFLMFGQGLAWHVIIAGYTASILISVLPISFAGLGTREAFYIGYLGQFGVQSEVALTISILDGLLLPIIGFAATTAVLSTKNGT